MPRIDHTISGDTLLADRSKKFGLATEVGLRRLKLWPASPDCEWRAGDEGNPDARFEITRSKVNLRQSVKFLLRRHWLALSLLSLSLVAAPGFVFIASGFLSARLLMVFSYLAIAPVLLALLAAWPVARRGQDELTLAIRLAVSRQATLNRCWQRLEELRGLRSARPDHDLILAFGRLRLFRARRVGL